MNSDFNRRTRSRVALFYNEIDDIIATRLVQGEPGYSDNIGRVKVVGAEAEHSHRLRNGSSLAMNFSYQDPTNKLNNSRMPEVPLFRANFTYNYRISRQLGAFAGVLYESALSRDQSDSRSEVDDVATLDFAVNWNNYEDTLRLSASLYNALDEDLVDPSPAGLMESDYPQAGRTFMLDITVLGLFAE